MDFIVNEPDPLLDAFFDKFNSAWLRPNQVEGFRAYALSLLPEAHRKNIEALSAKIVKQPYHRLDAAGDERAGAGLARRFRSAARDASGRRPPRRSRCRGFFRARRSPGSHAAKRSAADVLQDIFERPPAAV